MNEQQQADAWFAIEEAVGKRFGSTLWFYGEEIWGGCLEEGYRLERVAWMKSCPNCGRFRCKEFSWEAAEGGSLNLYTHESCDACGYDVDDED